MPTAGLSDAPAVGRFFNGPSESRPCTNYRAINPVRKTPPLRFEASPPESDNGFHGAAPLEMKDYSNYFTLAGGQSEAAACQTKNVNRHAIPGADAAGLHDPR